MLTKDNYHFSPLNLNSDVKLDFMYYGWHKCDCEHSNFSSIKRCFTLHVVLNGKGYYTTADHHYTLGKNDIFLIRPAEYISYYPDHDDPWEYVWIGFSGADAEKLIQDLGFSNTLAVRLNDVSACLDIFNHLKNPSFAEGKNNYALNGYLFILIGELIRQKPGVLTPVGNGDTALQKAIKFIGDNYNQGISVTGLSDYMCMERTTLFKLFKTGIGISPQQYIITYKLKIAQQYICETNFSLFNIASICGFNNYMHFSRSFSAYFHKSPCEMRKQHQYENDYSTPPLKIDALTAAEEKNL